MTNDDTTHFLLRTTMTSKSLSSRLSSELSSVANLTTEAVLSGAWAYPLRGILYFLAHPALYRAAAPVLLKSALVSLAIVAFLFLFTYLPQAAFCALFSGPLGFVAAVPLVLGEAYALIALVSRAFFLGQAQDDICTHPSLPALQRVLTAPAPPVDAVLLQQGHDALVERGRTVSKTRGGIRKLGKSVTAPLSRFGPAGIARYLVSLPLNALPGVGTALFLLYNGTPRAPLCCVLCAG